jgi:hypothetical protein
MLATTQQISLLPFRPVLLLQTHQKVCYHVLAFSMAPCRLAYIKGLASYRAVTWLVVEHLPFEPSDNYNTPGDNMLFVVFRLLQDEKTTRR